MSLPPIPVCAGWIQAGLIFKEASMPEPSRGQMPSSVFEKRVGIEGESIFNVETRTLKMALALWFRLNTRCEKSPWRREALDIIF